MCLRKVSAALVKSSREQRTFSAPSAVLPPFRFRGIWTSIRCRMMVVWFVIKQMLAIPSARRHQLPFHLEETAPSSPSPQTTAPTSAPLPGSVTSLILSLAMLSHSPSPLMIVKSLPTSRSSVWNAPFLTCGFSDETLPETCS